MRKLNLIVLSIAIYTPTLFAQVSPNKVVGEKNTTLLDSLEQTKYPYSLPIWGEAATQKGYQLPYSAGLSVNYIWQQSDLELNNLNVGFNNGPMIFLDQIVRFNSATSTLSGVNVRPDIWLFPFLNVYGIFAKAKSSTAIAAGIYLPDTSNNWREIVEFSSKAEFDVTTAGFGITPTTGIGGYWLALDMNMTWSDVSALDKPVFTFIFDPRIGKTLNFKKPERNIALWIGGFRINYTSETKGSLKLTDVLPIDETTNAKIDQGYSKVDEYQVQVDEWWNNLSSVEQKNPTNIAKYQTANTALSTAGNVLNSLDGAASTAKTSTVQYSLDKKLINKWSFAIGSQFQLNKHFMFRAEYAFASSRQQFVASLQYRFGL